ncbi:YHS domain-containing protein [Pseudomonas sp. BGI-2]|nr:YHS domain-containing protein [Pseudomonas sp. BGI-2]
MTASNDSQFSTKYEWQTYQFCSQKCQTIFRAAPERYRISQLKIEHVHQTTAEPLTGAAEYTCPMHPENSPDRPRRLP